MERIPDSGANAMGKGVDSAMGSDAQQWQMSLERSPDDALLIRLSGSWRSSHALPSAAEVHTLAEEEAPAGRVRFDAQGITDWDSGLLTFLAGLIDGFAERGTEVDREGLPEGVQRLLTLARAVPEKKDAREKDTRQPFLAMVGMSAIEFSRSAGEVLGFLGESLLAFGKMLRGKAVFRRADVGLLIQECGPGALPIVTLISVLIGMILAFVGAFQLRMFGAEIYIAAAVALGTVREMSPMMVGIIMAGRTGAAFAAQIGTMEVNEEIDALRTMRISPMEFLVLPRMLALGFMMPMLCLYADLMGIVGGAAVGVAMFGLPLTEYLQHTWTAVGLADFGIGIFKGVVFGVVVAVAGCLRGMQCGRSASAVGDAATSAVVTGIVAIIVLDSLAAIVSTVLGI
jgi:phospholipid/cholesterol/gamma-HCH transport system permease protein